MKTKKAEKRSSLSPLSRPDIQVPLQENCHKQKQGRSPHHAVIPFTVRRMVLKEDFRLLLRIRDRNKNGITLSTG